MTTVADGRVVAGRTHRVEAHPALSRREQWRPAVVVVDLWPVSGDVRPQGLDNRLGDANDALAVVCVLQRCVGFRAMLEMNESALQINVSEIQRPEAAEASASEPRQFEIGVAAGPLLGAVAVGRKQPLGPVGFEDCLVGLLVGRRCGEFDAVGQLVVGDVDAGAVLQQLPKCAEFVPERDFGEPFAASVGLELLDIPRREVADGFDFVGLTPAIEVF